MTKVLCLVLTFAFAALAQAPVAEIRAKITGGGGSGGKCTGEVDIDDAVEIQIFGDTARMQTLGGQPATWKRLECTSVMPGTPTGFRFSGVDGRGRQSLVRDPNDGLGVAVIRIEDSQRGRQGYTFDITWSGGTGAPSSANNGGFNNTTQAASANNGGFGNTAGTGGFGQTAQATAQPADIADFAYAVHGCQEAIVSRAAQNGFGSVVVWAANLQDNAGNNDVISGNATAIPSRGGNQVRIQYQCTVDAATGRVVDLQTR
jgi:hypothetical protein